MTATNIIRLFQTPSSVPEAFDQVLAHARSWNDQAEDKLEAVSCAIVHVQQLQAAIELLRDITPSRSATADQLDLWIARCRLTVGELKRQEGDILLRDPEYRAQEIYTAQGGDQREEG
jgi:hypothetical protein